MSRITMGHLTLFPLGNTSCEALKKLSSVSNYDMPGSESVIDDD